MARFRHHKAYNCVHRNRRTFERFGLLIDPSFQAELEAVALCHNEHDVRVQVSKEIDVDRDKPMDPLVFWDEEELKQTLNVVQEELVQQWGIPGPRPPTKTKTHANYVLMCGSRQRNSLLRRRMLESGITAAVPGPVE